MYDQQIVGKCFCQSFYRSYCRCVRALASPSAHRAVWHTSVGARNACRWSGLALSSSRKCRCFPGGHEESLVRDVLVVDNDGRSDESCVGDLTVLEARAVGVAGLVVRGYHRDTNELVRLGIPVFSYGSYPAGPRRLDQRGPLDLSSAQWDGFTVDGDDVVFADDDGVLSCHRAESKMS